MGGPLVSIITPAYNAQAFIAETVESVLAQTYSNWEMVLVDDGSTDATAEVVRSFGDDRIRVIDGGGTGLPAGARNVGFREARGELVALLDHDDLWRPEKLERQVALMTQRPEVGLSHTAADVLRNGEVEVASPEPDTAREDDMLRRLAAGNFICASSVILQRELITRYGGQDEDRALRATPDFEHWLRLAPHTVFGFVPEPLVLYRVHETNVTANRRQVDLGISLALVKTMERNPDAFDAATAARARRTLAINRVLAGMTAPARRELWRIVRSRPGDAVAWKWLAYSLLPSGAAQRLRTSDH